MYFFGQQKPFIQSFCFWFVPSVVADVFPYFYFSLVFVTSIVLVEW